MTAFGDPRDPAEKVAKSGDARIVLRAFRPEDAEAFRRLNEAWILRWFVLEPEDVAMLEDPQTHILDRGGRIFVAECNHAVVGCFALLPWQHGVLRLIRMTVREDVRGHGVGRMLLEHAVATAREMRAPKLVLETSTKLESAVHLYQSVGFERITLDPNEPVPLARADVYMELPLRYD